MITALLIAQLFSGSISRADGVTRVLFTNLPPHVVIQHSTDLINWVDMLRVERLSGTNRLGSFGYDVTDETGAIFIRARTP